MSEHYTDFINFLDIHGKLQKYLNQDITTEERIEKIKELKLNNSEIKGVLVYDQEIIDLVDEVYNYAQPIKDLFNHIPILYTNNTIPNELVFCLKEYVTFKTK